ncbi:KxYKxGKxW signal peptide domain-containing protein [Secundilactobacillus kimchicus]|uniref:KxYKxGKxW signal peptide domain-containing protein n=1 Tax=Secundilactobacillus kimchicus TaxID=528209 RepID=UPI0024A8D2A4|nr:KxYKxGKxW signal peptide domain-containing protein [Secundilactobacillus kimchicus]
MTKRIKKAHDKLVAASMDKKEHYKLYKSGKRWLIAGVMVASFAGSFFGIDQAKDAQAATTDTTNTQQSQSGDPSTQDFNLQSR